MRVANGFAVDMDETGSRLLSHASVTQLVCKVHVFFLCRAGFGLQLQAVPSSPQQKLSKVELVIHQFVFKLESIDCCWS